MNLFQREILFLCSIFAFLSVGAASAQSAKEARLLRISTGSVAGVYYEIGVELCEAVNKRRHSHGVWCAVEGSNGSVENLEKLQEGLSEIAISQSNVLAEFNRSRSLEQAEFRAFAKIYSESLHFFASPGSNIGKLSDITNKRVNIGEEGSGTRAVVDDLLRIHGIDIDSIRTIFELNPTEQVSALCNDKIDVSFWVSAVPNAIGSEIVDKCGGVLVGVSDPEVLKKIISEGYEVSSFASGDYRGIDEEIGTLSVEALLVPSHSVSQEDLRTLIEELFKSRYSLIKRSRYISDLSIFSEK